MGGMDGHRGTRILLVGGGWVGAYTALRLERRLGPAEAQITLVSPENFLLYQPLLPEVASGTLEARHAVVPLRRVLRRTRLVHGSVMGLDHDRRVATVDVGDGEMRELGYDHVAIGLGSVTRLLPIPGLAEHAIGFSTVAEATYLRDHVLGCLEVADASADPERRRRALTFVFVGGGYTGVEALGELQDLAAEACALYGTLDPAELRWLLVEATDRILPIVEPALSAYSTQVLRERGVRVATGTTLESAEGGCLRLSTGEQFEADTLVWAAGVRPNPLVAELGLPVTERVALRVDACLRVEGAPGAWAAGDCAAVPDLLAGEGKRSPATAQYAVRQARQLGDNLTAAVRGEQPRPFRHRALGEMVTLGRHDGVAQIMGRTLRGFLPWYLRRLYYLLQIPTSERKLRVFLDWSISLAFRRDITNLGSVTGSLLESWRRQRRPA